MEGVDPGDLEGLEEGEVDEGAGEGEWREVVELEPLARAVGEVRSGGDGDEVAFDSEAEVAVLVEARLVGDVVAGADLVEVLVPRGGRGEALVGADGAAADAKGPLVHVQEAAHAVARAVEVVEAVLPERGAGEGV